MKKQIKAAELRKYNANTRGNNVGDCVKRAISLACDISYAELSKLLNEKVKSTGHGNRPWNSPTIYNQVLDLLGCSKWITDGIEYSNGYPITTLDEFADDIADSSKSYIVEVGKRSYASHLVCVRDGKIWDSWDSREYVVFQYCIAPTSRKIQEESLDLKYITYNVVAPLIESQIHKCLSKRGLQLNNYKLGIINKSNYNIKVKPTIYLAPTDYSKDVRPYSFKINYTFDPTMDYDEAVAYIEKITPQRVYDRIYVVNENEKKLKEAAEIEAQLGDQEDNDLWLNRRDERFLNTLPGWVRPLVTWLHIQSPGQYSDSYTLDMRALPTDPRHDKVYFEAAEASSIRAMLDRYKQTLEVPHEDYDPYEEGYY